MKRILKNKGKGDKGEEKNAPTFLESDNLQLFMLCPYELSAGGSMYSKRQDSRD